MGFAFTAGFIGDILLSPGLLGTNGLGGTSTEEHSPVTVAEDE